MVKRGKTGHPGVCKHEDITDKETIESFDSFLDFKQQNHNFRVLLDKPPDIETPIVWGQFSFGCIINSTYSGGLPKLKSLDLGACTVPWDANQDLELK